MQLFAQEIVLWDDCLVHLPLFFADLTAPPLGKTGKVDLEFSVKRPKPCSYCTESHICALKRKK